VGEDSSSKTKARPTHAARQSTVQATCAKLDNQEGQCWFPKQQQGMPQLVLQCINSCAAAQAADGICCLQARPCSPPCSSPALQAAQLGETAGKLQSFLSAHRPTSPGSRGSSRPGSPTLPAIRQQQQQQICTVSEQLTTAAVSVLTLERCWKPHHRDAVSHGIARQKE
jgi:hypothetical protein